MQIKNQFAPICVLIIFFLVFAPPSFAQNSAGSETPSGLVTDASGQQWTAVEGQSSQDAKKWIQMEGVSANELIHSISQANYKGIPLESLKALPSENLRFSAAKLIVTMATCFGPGLYDGVMQTSSFVLESSPSDPNCMHEFVQQLLDIKGWISFYGFIVAHRGSQTAILENILKITAAYRGSTDPVVIQRLAMKIHPWANYIGMSVGSLASSIITYFLSAPDWKNCFKYTPKEGPLNQFCKDAVTYVTNVDGFWDDFVGSSTSMILAGMASAKTAQLMVKTTTLLKALKQGKQISGIQMVGSTAGAAEAVEQGVSLATKVRYAPGLLAGAPGLFMVVVTSVGQYVLFIAWNHYFEVPVMSTLQDFVKSGTINTTIAKMEVSLQQSKALGWDKPYLVDRCIPKNNIILPMDLPAEVQSQMGELDCKKTMPLVDQVALLNKTAAAFRAKVILAELNKATEKWSAKVKDYLVHYRVFKSILQYVFEQREEQQKSKKDMTINGEQLYAKLLLLWSDVVEDEDTVLLPLIKDKLKGLVERSKDRTQNLLVLDENKDNQITFDGTERDKRLLAEYASLRAQINQLFKNQPLDDSTCARFETICFARRWTYHFDGTKTIVNANGAGFLQIATHLQFLEALKSSFGARAVNETFSNMLCTGSQNVQTKGLSSRGDVADIYAPFLLKGVNQSEFFNTNCRTYGQIEAPDSENFSDHLFQRTWVLDNKIYADPISLFIDTATTLSVGGTTAEMTDWWNKNIFFSFNEFMKSTTIEYQKMLNKNLLTQIPKVKVGDLIHESSPQQRGPELVRYIGSPVRLTFETPLLADSWMAQVQYITEIFQRYAPLARSAETDQLLVNLQTDFANYILSLNQPINPQELEKTWNSSTLEFQLHLNEKSAFSKALMSFGNQLREMSFGRERVKQIIENRQKLQKDIDQLYKALTGQEYGDLGSETEMWKRGLTQEQMSALNGKDYQKYIFYRLFHESLTNVLSEINSIYSKLALEPLAGFGKE